MCRKVSVLLCVYLAAATALVGASPGSRDVRSRSEAHEPARLPNNTIPQAYAINLIFGDFDRGDMRFTGSAYITISVRESTNTITLHTSVLVLNTSLTRLNYGGNDIAHTHDIDYEREFLLIRTTEETLPRFSTVLLRIDYSGVVGTSDEEEGIFRHSYLNGDGSMSYYVATRTRPNYARRIFPSYDEPSFKASFQIALSHSPRYRVISNMREFTSFIDPESGRRVSTFNSTSYLPPYLVAFIISEFDMIANSTAVNDIALRIFGASSQQTQNAAFALELTQQALEIFENKFSYAFQYGIDKLDQVALPFFNQRSVVSYGIAFYRKNCLLYEPSVSTAREKEAAALAIINNVCHQLLDSKMTPAWWSSDHISGGLCKFYEYQILEREYPTIAVEGLFTVETMESALLADTVADAMRWEQSESVAYNKSASIFRMLFHSLSEATFSEGLRIYLSQSSLNPLGVTSQRDLYDAWQRAASIVENNGAVGNYKVEELFGSWEREGYPILQVERSYNDHRVRFTQKSVRDADTSLWHIPVTYGMKDGERIERFWMPQTRQHEIMIDGLRPDSFLLINVDRMGYYRVHYDDANWMLISRELSRAGSSSSISPISRAMLMNDAAAFLANNMLSARIFFELIRHLEHDAEYLPWLVATNNLQYMRWMVIDGSTKMSDDFKRFLQKLLLKAFTTYGIEEQAEEANYHKHVRNIAVAWSCGVHLQSCLDVTREKLWKFMSSDESGSISVDHEAVIFCGGLIMATEHEFDVVWKTFKRTTSEPRRRLLLSAIGCIEDEGVLTKFVAMSTEDEDIGGDEVLTILKATYGHNHVGVRVALKFLRNNYEALIGVLRRHNSESSLDQIFRDIASRVSDRESLTTLADILVIYDADVNTQEEIYAIASGNLKWLDLHSEDIQLFLSDFHQETSSTATLLPVSRLLLITLLLLR